MASPFSRSGAVDWISVLLRLCSGFWLRLRRAIVRVCRDVCCEVVDDKVLVVRRWLYRFIGGDF